MSFQQPELDGLIQMSELQSARLSANTTPSVPSSSNAANMNLSTNTVPFVPSSSNVESPDYALALERVADERLHQSITLPATNEHGSLRVTYAVVGSEDRHDPVILFLAGMFGGRWMAVQWDYLAKKIGVRVICVDRPGMGGSTRVDLKQRVSVWLETVPALLNHLKVKHVSLLSHSCGSIYLVQTLLHLPDILSPTKPYAAFMVPWVHARDSHVKLMRAAGLIPADMFSHWNELIKIIVNFKSGSVAASMGTSSDAFSAFSSLFSSGNGIQDEASENAFMEYCGMTREQMSKLVGAVEKCIFAEDTTGGNEEAKLCLQKEGPSIWGVDEDYLKFLPTLVESLRSRTESTVRLEVHAYYAEKDSIIGKGGQKYFENLWSSNQYTDIIGFKTHSIAKTDHDSVCDPTKGIIDQIFREVKGYS